MNNKSTAILVLSCDKYSDVWGPFFLFFQKYWNDCPFPVYLGTNEKKIYFKNVIQVFSHKKTTWSDELTSILNQIPEKYVIIILEDYFIFKPVINEDIYKIVTIMNQHNAAYMKLGAFPKKYDILWPHKPMLTEPGIGVIEKGSKYRLCLQTAIWNKDILLGLLNPMENPWQFELEASKRSNLIDNPFLCVISNPKQRVVHGPINYYCTALSAGKWMRGAIRLCKKENIEIDVASRPIESFYQEMKRKAYIALPINLRKVVNFLNNKINIAK
jgi:hypothetical protein